MKIVSAVILSVLIGIAGPVLADKTAGQVIDDSVVQAAVKTKLLGDDFASGAAINIETRKGVVQLGGFVDSTEEAERAGAVAAAVDGVRHVDNQLHLKPGPTTVGQEVDDGLVTTRVKSLIAEQNPGTGWKVNVDTHNGVVLLTGFVGDPATRDNVVTIAEGAKQVISVINGIYVLD